MGVSHMGSNTGVSEEVASTLADQLHQILSDHFILYIKTLNCHWNVEGPRFIMLHELFEDQYKALADQGDDIAERIRQLGKKVPASMKDFLEHGSMEEIQGDLSEEEMLRELTRSHEKAIHRLKEVIALADEHRDPSTADLLTETLEFHDKTAWFLRSHL